MLRCVIVDDEPFAIDIIQSYAKKIPFLKVEATFNDAVNASEYLRGADIDLLFLDVQMPHVNGIQLLKSLKNPPMVIFTTAFNQYAVEGFELEAIDYLLKPFDLERFQKAVNKAFERYKLKKGTKESERFIFVKADYQMVKINLEQIQFIEGWDDYIKIYIGEKPLLTLMSLKAILELLPNEEFMRVHRSYIVPVAKIESIRNKVIKVGNHEIPVGATYIELINNFLSKR